MEETFEQVYAACGEMLYRLAALYLGSAGEAEDVLQDVFVKFLSRRRTFQDEEHRKRWLIRVTVNLCKDHLRSARRQKTVPLEERDLVGREEDREILSLVLGMPEIYRAAVHLHYYEGYSVEEIGKILGLSVSAVKMRLKRGREYLRLEMEDGNGHS